MRLTPYLFGEFRKGFWFKNIWKKKSRFIVKPAPITEDMKEMGINPVDPTVDFFPTKKKVGLLKDHFWFLPACYFLKSSCIII